MHRWKWSRKKPPIFPLLVLFFMVFIAFSTFHSEHSIQQIHENPDHVHNHQEASYVKPNLSGQLKQAPEVLDRFSRCNSTVEYSGRKIAWSGDSLRSSHRRASPESCDVFSGKWVFDNASYPLYSESDCPYMSDQLACHKHGRSDLRYQHWRWQPHNCNLKRWNVKEMWEKLRGKRLMFVGDSLNRGQWISMVCLLQSVIPSDKRSMSPNAHLTIFRAESVIPSDKRSMSPNAHLTIFRAEEYNASVEFLWAPLLVESNSDDPVNHRLGERIIRPDSVLKHASLWEHADILVFNTYLWWRQGPVKLLWTSEENGACEELNGQGAMEAWADWISSKVDPLKKRVFFVTMSPTHLWIYHMMGAFTIQISNDLVDQLVDEKVIKKKTRKTRQRKVARETEKLQPNVTGKPENAAAPGWPVQSPLFPPAKLPVQPSHSEIEGIRSVLQESEKVLESLQKQEENMLREVTQKAKELHDKEYKLPNPKPEPCMAERLATLSCYKEHIKDPLKCSGLVTNFADCLRRFGRLGDK